ncbi:MAG: hypothetical protein KA998_00555 [Rickettsiaceae bacterium]|nr:hypothetical protein [Rickettsiaceae bacterium]
MPKNKKRPPAPKAPTVVTIDYPDSIALATETGGICREFLQAKIRKKELSHSFKTNFTTYLEQLKLKDSEILTENVSKELLRLTSLFCEKKNNFNNALQEKFKDSIKSLLNKKTTFEKNEEEINKMIIEIHRKIFNELDSTVTPLASKPLVSYNAKVIELINNKFVLETEGLHRSTIDKLSENVIPEIPGMGIEQIINNTTSYAFFDTLSKNPTLFDKQNLTNAIETLRLDMGPNFVAAEDMTTYIAKIARTDLAGAIDILEFLIGCGINLNREFIQHNITAQFIKELQKEGNSNVFKIIKHLLENHDINLNISLKPQAPNDLIMMSGEAPNIETIDILSMVVGIHDFKLASKTAALLLDHGMLTREILSKYSFRSEENYSLPSEYDQTTYIKKIYTVVEIYLLTRLEILSTPKPQEIIKPSEIESKEDLERSFEKEARKEAIEKAIDQVIALNETAIKSPSLQLSEEEIFKNKFDSLLLRYIKTPREFIIDKINELLDQNPDLHSYCLTSALKESDNPLVPDVFSYNQKLLQKFFESKKANMHNEESKGEAPNQNLAEGVFKIISKFGDAFFRIAENLAEMIGAAGEKLSKIEFIKTSSKGENGIKIYPNNTAKLKLSGSDKAPYSEEIFTCKGEMMIFFNKYATHKQGSNLSNKHFQELTEEQAYTFKYGSEPEFMNIIGHHQDIIGDI